MTNFNPGVGLLSQSGHKIKISGRVVDVIKFMGDSRPAW